MQKERRKREKRKKSLTVDTLRGGGRERGAVERGINTQPHTHTREHTDTDREIDRQTGTPHA